MSKYSSIEFSLFDRLGLMNEMAKKEKIEISRVQHIFLDRIEALEKKIERLERKK